MTEYKIDIPEEPEVGSKVEDVEGDVWTKDEKQWTCRGCNTIKSWKSLLIEYGPLKSIDIPKVGEVRSSPLNTTVIAVFDGENWIRWEYLFYRKAFISGEKIKDIDLFKKP